MPGLSGLSGLKVLPFGTRAIAPFDFDLAAMVFTPGMDKRTGTVFAAAPICQGAWDGTGTPDEIEFPFGAQIGNPTDNVYANADPHQGTLSFWITPEWDGDDGLEHRILTLGFGVVRKTTANTLQFRYFDGGTFRTISADVSAWVAGTLYHVVCSYDANNFIDDVNYMRLSLNNTHTYGTTTIAPYTPSAILRVGSTGTPTLSADAIIEGVRIDDFVWLDDNGYGNYGLSMGVDLITYAYAAGAGADPGLVVGSWGGKFCLPTDATPGPIVTGTDEAWSHPLASALLDQGTLWDGGVFGNTYCVEFNATTTEIDCGSDVDIDDIHDAEFTAEAWIRADGWGEGNFGRIIDKANVDTVGWRFNLHSTEGLLGWVDCATTNAVSSSGTDEFPLDGKWHHVVMYFNDAGDRNVYLAIDGRWVTSYDRQVAGVGAIVSDAAEDLYIGNLSNGSQTFDGGIAWVAISNNDRHTVGTDFIPPNAFPADDANYLASWHMDEGTGVAIANTGNQGGAGSGAANRDGTLANGSWSSLWEDSGSPVMSTVLEYDGAATNINCGSDVDIDDVPGADCTVEFWGRFASRGEGDAAYVMQKSDAFRVLCRANGVLRILSGYATTDARTDTGQGLYDNRWHHVAFVLDFATRTWTAYVDGVDVSQAVQVGVGAYDGDAVSDLHLGNDNASARTMDGALGWFRISNNQRYTGTFTPLDRHNPPGDDANALALWQFRDGAGTTLDNIGDQAGGGSGPANRDGTITLGAGQWINDQDVATVSPGACIFGNRGLEFGSDGANDGLVHEETVVAETDYVLMLTAHPGADGRGMFQVRLRDVSNAVNIDTVLLPQYVGTHDGGAAQANLSDSGARWLNSQINADAVVYNITDGESATLGADPCSGDMQTITTALSGGTWDNGDVYRIVWPTGGYRDHPMVLIFCFKIPAQCTSLQVFLEETSGEGTLYLHRVEIQPNELLNGDHEDLDGGAPGAAELITGWTNAGLDAGDTEPEAVIVHSGAQSLEWNPGAVANEGMRYDVTATIGDFFGMGGWHYGTGIVDLLFGTGATTRGLLQYSIADFKVSTGDPAYWQHAAGVWRATSTGFRVLPTGVAGAAADRFSDDWYAIALDAVTLTITPASQANSLEGTGIRVDGYDGCQDLIEDGEITANAGDIRWPWTPRHSDAQAVAFDATAWIMRTDGGVNNFIDVVWNVANNLRLQFNANGAGIQIGDWATGGGQIVPGTTYQMRVRWWANRMRLYIDDVLRITITAPTGFVWPFPVPHYWGSTDTLVSHCDAVFG